MVTVLAFSDERSQSGLCSFFILRTSGTEPKVCTILVRDNSSDPNNTRHRSNTTWRAKGGTRRRYPPCFGKSFMFSRKNGWRQQKTTCHALCDLPHQFQCTLYVVNGSIEPPECVSCFATQTLPFFTASSLTLASIEFFFTLWSFSS